MNKEILHESIKEIKVPSQFNCYKKGKGGGELQVEPPLASGFWLLRCNVRLCGLPSGIILMHTQTQAVLSSLISILMAVVLRLILI